MVERNYRLRPIDDTLDCCIQTALDDFQDGCIYIVNATKNARYTQLNDALGLCENDEIMLIKLKYVRGIIW